MHIGEKKREMKEVDDVFAGGYQIRPDI